MSWLEGSTTIPLSTLGICILILIAAPTICALVTLGTHRFATRHHRKEMKRKRQELNDWSAKLSAYGTALLEREQAVEDREERQQKREGRFRQRALNTGAIINAELDLMADATVIMDPVWD